tara:strand:- start:212 stop:919 length:708 start_codon:yes stop_codon:yes gene_type:complete
MSCLGTNKLNILYQELSKYPQNDIKHRFNIERPEQELIAKYLPKDCCVLEMGGESGTTSLIINKILKDPTKHVLVEPSRGSIPKLQYVKNLYNTKFHIVHGFVGKNKESHIKLWPECQYCTMVDLIDLEKLVNQKFDVLVIDCEGAFYNILHDMPHILNDIKLIIIEMDGPDTDVPFVRNKIRENNFELIHSQAHPYFNNDEDTEFGQINNVKDLNKLKRRENMIGFHEVYVKFS